MLFGILCLTSCLLPLVAAQESLPGVSIAEPEKESPINRMLPCHVDLDTGESFDLIQCPEPLECNSVVLETATTNFTYCKNPLVPDCVPFNHLVTLEHELGEPATTCSKINCRDGKKKKSKKMKKMKKNKKNNKKNNKDKKDKKGRGKKGKRNQKKGGKKGGRRLQVEQPSIPSHQ